MFLDYEHAKRQLEFALHRAGLARDQTAVEMARLVLNSQDENAYGDYLAYLDMVAATLEPEPVMLPAPKQGELPPGVLYQGNMIYGPGQREPFHNPVATTHHLIGGGSRTGKSWYAKFQTCEWIKQGNVVWIPDTEDESIAHLTHFKPGDIWVIDVSKGEYKSNVFEPLPGESPLNCIARCRDWGKELWIGAGGMNIMEELLIQMLTERDIALDNIPAGDEEWPTLVELFERIPKVRRRQDARRQQYIESLQGMLSMVCNSSLKQCYDVVHGYDFSELTKHNIIFRLASLSRDQADFFICELLSRLSDFKLRNPGLPLVMVVIDEAHGFYLQKNRPSGATPLLFDLHRSFRKRGVQLCLSTQILQKQAEDLLINTAMKTFLRITDESSAFTISRSIGLPDPKLLSQLPPRTAIYHHFAYHSPFLILIPELNFLARPSETEIHQIMQPILSNLKWKPRQDVASNILPHDKRGKPAPVEAAQPPLISRQAEDYLIYRPQTPHAPPTYSHRRMHLTNYKGQTLREELERAEFLRIHKVSFGGRSGVHLVLEITQVAYDYLASKGIVVKPPRGKGSWLHKWYAFLVHKAALKRFPGWHAVIEDSSSGGRSVDVSVTLPGNLAGAKARRIAYEVLVHGEVKELSNVVKDVEVGGYNEVILCCSEPKTLEHLRKLAEEAFGQQPEIMEKVSFSLLSQFI